MNKSTDFFERTLDDQQFIAVLNKYIPNYLTYVVQFYLFKKNPDILTMNDPLFVKLISLCHLNAVRLKNQDIHVVYYAISLAIKSHYKTLQIYYSPV